ncbi:tRNA uridine-5-carboxymethylaminomethyl(34) synthesis GTPase MnmE [Sphingomonas abietis]|uniref:tRNA modification GTPase MnmE n=1 Tax=Sphingomonas abietis TaxID=3012344 RepID=A0ABY7NPK5_9SPHN|nr:tRNA uridine-5-carboxymethylaminomethyl(34) synthesis GTPase MnmE [Sphingomonas abietis]WBO22573.1 tRNA uridine-5-carboxymethylaminomethyl(34) synthesis GTPase MnmE [Sphingomonas abietis]
MDRANNTAATETIFALSSGAPPAAIGIIRISGPLAGAVGSAVGGGLPEPRRASLRALRNRAGDILDHALLLWFPGPATVTGEDLCELHIHGGRATIDAVFAELRAQGCRMAAPGEFTRRALFNGRMDLSEVEGLADLLAAETESQRREALRRADGALSRKLGGWRDALTIIAARIEAAIDYDGEDDVIAATDGIDIEIAGIGREIEAALAVAPAERLREGIKVTIIGPPNAGKSTLFNALVGREAAIVSDIAGTTRDLIEHSVAIAGVPFVFVDTAGIRDTIDPVERIGVARARHARALTDIILDLAGDAEDERSIAIAAMADILPARAGALPVSAVTGEGVAALQLRLCALARSMLPAETEVALDRRYRDMLIAVGGELAQARSAPDMLLMAEHVRIALAQFDGILGGDAVEDMLDALFGRFCLGK